MIDKFDFYRGVFDDIYRLVDRNVTEKYAQYIYECIEAKCSENFKIVRWPEDEEILEIVSELTNGRITKTIRVTIDLPMDFPNYWDNNAIECYFENNSHGTTAILEELKKRFEKNNYMCDIFKCKVID